MPVLVGWKKQKKEEPEPKLRMANGLFSKTQWWLFWLFLPYTILVSCSTGGTFLIHPRVFSLLGIDAFEPGSTSFTATVVNADAVKLDIVGEVFLRVEQWNTLTIPICFVQTGICNVFVETCTKVSPCHCHAARTWAMFLTN